MDGHYFRIAKFEKWNPKWTQGSKWVKLATKIIDYDEDFREVSDGAKLTLVTLIAAAPKQKNVFPNKLEDLKVILGIQKIELDELYDMEFLEIVHEQQMFEGFKSPQVASNEKNQADIDKLVSAWNDMARQCGLVERTRIKYDGKIYKTIVTRFKEPEWIENFPKALESIPGLELLTKEGAIGTGKWRANFDWFIQTNSVDMILNGKYGKPVHTDGTYYDEEIPI